jgi:hypothetical protein
VEPTNVSGPVSAFDPLRTLMLLVMVGARDGQAAMEG